MNKIMVTGATGMLGRALCKKLINQSFELIPCGYSRAEKNIHKLDLCDFKALEQFIQEYRPEAIIHCAAERRPDVSERDPEGTKRLNIEASLALAEISQKHNCWLLYISTDYVFDGTAPPYFPDSICNPLNFYGESKRDGEIAVMSVSEKNTVLRVPVLYGDVETLDESAVTVIAKSLNQENLKLDHWAKRFPTHVDDVADVISQMINKQAEFDLSGYCHWSAREQFTKYEMALIMADILGLESQRFQANSAPPGGAPRPKNCQLNCDKLKNMGIEKYSDFKKNMDIILNRMCL